MSGLSAVWSLRGGDCSAELGRVFYHKPVEKSVPFIGRIRVKRQARTRPSTPRRKGTHLVDSNVFRRLQRCDSPTQLPGDRAAGLQELAARSVFSKQSRANGF